MEAGGYDKATGDGGPKSDGTVAPERPWLLRGWTPWVLLAGITILFWARTLSFEFVWDDEYFIERLPSIRSLKNIPEMFWSLDAQSAYPKGFVLFRPLRTAHYALLYALGGGEPPKAWLFHLANVLWHAAAVLLLFSILRSLLERYIRGDERDAPAGLALVAALGFALHPVATEVVCWAKSLDDLMATVFVLAAARLLLSRELTNLKVSAALLLFVFGLYSKISAAPFVILAALILRYVQRLELRRCFGWTAAFGAVLVAFMVHRHLVIGRTSQTAPISGTYAQTLLDTIACGPTYLRLLFGAPPFCIDYGYLKGGHAIFDWQVAAGLGLAAAVVIMAIRFLRRDGTVMAGLGLAWIGLMLLPASNLIPTMQYMAERFLYLPLAGFCMLLCWLVQLGRWRAGVIILFLASAVWGVVAWERAGIWRDELTLFVTSALDNNASERVVANAVSATFKLPHMRQVFRTEQVPGEIARHTLADAESLKLADWPKVQKTTEELARLFPTNEAALSAQGIVLAMTGHPGEAMTFFERSATLQPRKVVCWNNLGQAALAAGELEKSRYAFERALKLDAENDTALGGMAQLHLLQGRAAEALELARQRVKLKPDNSEAKRQLELIEAAIKAAATNTPPVLIKPGG